MKALLYGLLLPSGNDAAIALADHVAHTQPRFVAMMNAKARALGLKCTHYVSPHGLEPGNRSCAADLATLSRIVLQHSGWPASSARPTRSSASRSRAASCG